MPNNNVAILSIMSKFDEKSAREAAQRANKVYDEALSDIGNVNFDKKLLDNFDKAMNLLKNKFKKVNLSSYTNNLLDSIFSDKDISEKSKDIESFIKKIDLLKKASSGQDINAFNTFSSKQIEALISRTEKLAQKQDEINEKTREYNREATKIAKTNRSISTVDKNYGNQDYTKTLESLKKSLGTEKEFTAEQNQSIENLAKMVNLYQVMEKSEPQKGTAEAIRYSKDLLAVTQKIKEERDKIDAFSQNGASTYIANNGLSSIDKVSDYTVNKAKDDFTKANLSNLKAQETKLQSELTTYISDSVQKNLAKVSKEADAVIDKAEKRVENLQNKIDSLQSKPNNTVTDNSLIDNIVSDSDIKSLEEIEDRLYAISDLDADGEATKQQLKEYIQLYKQYEQLIANDSTVKFDPGLKEEYDFIIESDSKLKKYADTLDETIVKQKELNATKSDEKNTSTSVETEQLVKQEEQIKQTVQAEEKLIDTQNQLSSNTKISVDTEQAIADINKVKENLESIPDEKKIKISLNDNDYTNTPLLSDAEGNTITAFRGVVGAWSGLINQDGIGFFTDKLKLAADYADSLAESGKVYQANLSFKNPLEVEGNGAKWDEIDFNGVKKTTDEIVELAKQLGHDGVIFRNIRDGFTDTDEDISNVMVALNAAQIKNEQVIGTVKAGTGEMVDVASKIDNATDTATNSTVESQNKIQEELKETQKVAEQVSEAMSNVGSDKSNISSADDVAASFDKTEEKIDSVNEKLQESKKYVNELRQAFMNIVGKASNRDSLLEQYPELSEFKNKTSVDKARSFLNTDEWKDFLATLPNAHAYLESIGYDFERIYKLTDEEIKWFKGLSADELLSRGWNIGGTPDKADYKEIRAAYQTQIKDVIQGDDKANNSNVSFRSNLDDIEKEKSALLELRNTISLIIEEIDRKTQAFHNEKSAIDMIIPAEIAILESLEGELKIIIESIEQISKIPINIDFNLEKLDENSANAISKLKDSLSGFDGSSLTNISSILEGFKISKANVDNLQKLANAILTLKSNLNNVGNSGQQFLSDIKELVYQSDGLKDLATVLKASKKQIDTAKKTTNTDNQKTEENANAWEELTYSIQRYTEVSKRIANGKVLEGDVEEAERLENKISQLQKLDILSPTQIEKSEQMLIKLYDKLDDIERKAKKASLESMQSEIDSYNNKVPEKPIKKNSKFQVAIDNYKNAIKEAQTYLDNLGNTPITEEQTKQWKILTDNIEEAKKKMEAFSAAEKGSDEASRMKEIDKLTKYLDKNTRISKEAREQLQGYLALLKSGDPSVNVKEIHTAWTAVAVAEREAGREGKSFLDIFKNKVVYNYAAQLAGYYLSFMDIIRYGSKIVENVKEVDTALTELRKVSDATEQRLTANFKNSAETAKELGSSVSDVISATADWSRMGYNIDQSEELARISTLYKNVGDGIDIEEANNSLISTLQGFQLDVNQAESIVDKFNEVANNYAIDSAGIGEALQRSAASFNAANTDLSKSIALITATRLKKLVEYMETYIKNIFNCHRSLYYCTPQYRGNYYMTV